MTSHSERKARRKRRKAGTLSLGYHANDLLATLSQSGTEDGVTATSSQDFTLDVAEGFW